MKNKNDAFPKFKEWKVLIDTQTGRKVKRLRTDNGLEFCATEFDHFRKEQGIARHHTIRKTPQKNGVVERMNKTIMQTVRCMLPNANLSNNFWAEAVMVAAYVINWSPSRAIDLKNPEEKWSGRPPNLSNLRVFGCTEYAHINQGKLEPRAIKCRFLELWCVQGGQPRSLISRDVVFREQEMLYKEKEAST